MHTAPAPLRHTQPAPAKPRLARPAPLDLALIPDTPAAAPRRHIATPMPRPPRVRPHHMPFAPHEEDSPVHLAGLDWCMAR